MLHMIKLTTENLMSIFRRVNIGMEELETMVEEYGSDLAILRNGHFLYMAYDVNDIDPRSGEANSYSTFTWAWADEHLAYNPSQCMDQWGTAIPKNEFGEPYIFLTNATGGLRKIFYNETAEGDEYTIGDIADAYPDNNYFFAHVLPY